MPTRTPSTYRVITAALLLGLAPAWAQQPPAPAPASASAAAPAAAVSQQELDQLLAPIALYPDALVAQILMASTYPLEIVEAARWSKANPGSWPCPARPRGASRPRSSRGPIATPARCSSASSTSASWRSSSSSATAGSSPTRSHHACTTQATGPSEGAVTSQFQNHLRAVLGWPLGDTAPRGHAAMINLVGTHPPAAKLARLPRTHVHLYGKEPRAGRKLGHLTLVEASPGELETRLDAVLRAVRPELAGA